MQFDHIPGSGLKTPGQFGEVDNTQSERGLPGKEHRIFAFGQMFDTGTATPLTQIRITDPREALPLFGEGSMLAQMVEKIRDANNFNELVVVGIQDKADGTKATGTINYGGTDIRANDLNYLIGGTVLNIGVSQGDTPAEIATATAAAITARKDLKVNASVNGTDNTQVDLEAKHKGEAGNEIEIILNYYAGQYEPENLSVVISGMSGGAGNPAIAPVLAAVGDEWFTEYVMPYTDIPNIVELEDYLAAKFLPLEQQDAVAFAAKSATHSELITFGNLRNSPHLTIQGLHKAPQPAWERAASYAGVASYYLAIHPARPLQKLVMPKILPPKTEYAFDQLERNLLLNNGIATAKANRGVLAIERAVTTFQVNDGGYPDESYLDVNTMALIAYLRWSERVRIDQRFPRSGLRDDDPNDITGNEFATPGKVYNELVGLAIEWHRGGYIENLEEFKELAQTMRDPDDPNRINALNPADLTNQFRIYASKLQFRR